MTRPRLTLAVLDALTRCVVHAESVVHADPETHADDAAKIERADKWLSDMRAWRADKRRKGSPANA